MQNMADRPKSLQEHLEEQIPFLEANPGDILTLFLYSPELQQRQLKTVRVEER